MKFKHVIATIALASVMAVGAFAFASGNKESESNVALADQAITDSTLEIRFTRPKDWGDHGVRLHTFDGSGTTTWPGYVMTWLWDNEYGQAVFTWSPSASEPLRGTIIFNNGGNGYQSDDIVAPSTSKAYWYDDGWQSADAPTMDIFLYDYDNKYNGAVEVHASRGSFEDNYSLTRMTNVANNGLVYKATINNRYNSVYFHHNESSKTGDLTPEGNYCYVLANDDTPLAGKNTWWNNINYVFAHNFAQNTMLLRSIPTSDQSETEYCAERYATAKTAFGILMNSAYGSYVLNELNTNFADAMTRLSAWATANGEIFTPSTGLFSSRIQNNPIVGDMATNSYVTVIVVISLAALTAIGGYFFLRKRKEN